MNSLTKEQDDKVNKWVMATDQDVWQGKAPMAPQDAPPMTPLSDNEDKAPVENVVSSHPGLQPDSLGDEVKRNITQTNQYGPEQEKAVMQNVLNSQNSLGNKIARGGAAFSDALMQGVARAGNPGNLQNMENEQDKRDEMQVNAIPKLQEMSNAQIGTRNKLEEMSSGTPLGQAMAAALLDIVKQVYPGKTDAQYQAMMKNPAATASALGIAAPLLESQAKTKLAEAELGLHKQVADSTSANQQEQRKLEAAKALSSQTFLNRVTHPGVTKELNQAAGIESHPQDAEAIEWAKANQNDPRSKKILSLHGM